MHLGFQENRQSFSATELNSNMESQKLFDEELDDRAYTESFDDVMTICPRPGMSAQERYEFRKNIKPSLTKSDKDILNPKDFNILVARVNGLEQELEEIKQENMRQKKSSLWNIFAASLIVLFSSLAFGYPISEMLSSSFVKLIK
jgi:uncharacterized membrane protein YcjF (UPF0283 family)